VDLDKEIRLPRRGQALKSQGPIAPTTFGYDPDFKSEMSEFDLAKAKALLDLYGYTDKDGDGWRDLPDGRPLVLEYATSPDSERLALAEQWQKNMDALGVRIRFRVAKWPELLKASSAGKLQMWGVGWVTSTPDGDAFLALASNKAKGAANKARFDLPAFEALYDRQKALPDGPERLAAMTEAQKMMVAYMPYKIHVHRIYTDMAQPWVKGYQRNVYVRDFYKYVDVDEAAQARARP
jgi:ABC-type transport system substrate-binding protein